MFVESILNSLRTPHIIFFKYKKFGRHNLFAMKIFFSVILFVLLQLESKSHPPTKSRKSTGKIRRRNQFRLLGRVHLDTI